MNKHTLQEWADFTGCYVAVDENGYVCAYKSKPYIGNTAWFSYSSSVHAFVGINPELVEYDGEWRDSLTTPSELPFKDGELVIHRSSGNVMVWHIADGTEDCRDFCRPTEGEWRTLRGE